MRKQFGLRFSASLMMLCFFSFAASVSAAIPVTGQIDSITPISDTEYELAVQTPDGKMNRFLVMTSTLVQTSVPAASLKTGSEIIPPKKEKTAPKGTKAPDPLEMLKKPELPKKPEIPQIPKIPQPPKPIEMPQMPEKPEIPEIPQIPGMKQMPPQEKQSSAEPPPAETAAQAMPTPGGTPENTAGKKKEAPKDEMPPPDPFMTEPKTLEKTASEKDAEKDFEAPKKSSAPFSPRPFKKVLGVNKTGDRVNIEIENAGKKEELTLALKDKVLTSFDLEELQEEMTVTVDFTEEEDYEVARVITVFQN